MYNSGLQLRCVQSKIVKNLSANIIGTADEVVVGLNWTAVVGPLGVGLAQTPARDNSGCSGLPVSGSYTGRNLAELSTLTASENVFEQAIGFAAINAHHNRFDLKGNNTNGLDLIKNEGEQTVVIGQFPGLRRRVPKAIVIEREPRPGCLPESAASYHLPNAKYVLITASALINGTLTNLLDLTTGAYVVLVGPSATLSLLMFEHGIDAISGFVAHNSKALLRVVMEGGTVSAMRPHGRFLTLEQQ